MHKVDEVIERLRAANPSGDGATTLEDEAADLLASMKEALEPFAKAADARRADTIGNRQCFGQEPLLRARNALNGETGGHG